jgi:hypothetical protein
LLPGVVIQVRGQCQLSEDHFPDSEVKELFVVSDVDQSGGIDAAELHATIVCSVRARH